MDFHLSCLYVRRYTGTIRSKTELAFRISVYVSDTKIYQKLFSSLGDNHDRPSHYVFILCMSCEEYKGK